MRPPRPRMHTCTYIREVSVNTCRCCVGWACSARQIDVSVPRRTCLSLSLSLGAYFSRAERERECAPHIRESSGDRMPALFAYMNFPRESRRQSDGPPVHENSKIISRGGCEIEEEAPTTTTARCMNKERAESSAAATLSLTVASAAAAAVVVVTPTSFPTKFDEYGGDV